MNPIEPGGTLLLECIIYCHCDPGRTRKALLFGCVVDRIDNVRRERHVDDDVQTTFEAIDQPRDLTGEACDTRSFFSVGQRGFSNNHWTVGTDKVINYQSLGHAITSKGGDSDAELVYIRHGVGTREQAFDLLELGWSAGLNGEGHSKLSAPRSVRSWLRKRLQEQCGS
jgi:hypothetical protein